MQGFVHSNHSTLFTYVQTQHKNALLQKHQAYLSRLIDFCMKKPSFVSYTSTNFVIEKRSNMFVVVPLSTSLQLSFLTNITDAFTLACTNEPRLYKDIQRCILSYIEPTMHPSDFLPEECFAMSLSPNLQKSDIQTLLMWFVKHCFFYSAIPFGTLCPTVSYEQNGMLEISEKELLSEYALTLDSKGNMCCAKWDKYMNTIPIKSIPLGVCRQLRVKDFTFYYVFNPRETKDQKAYNKQKFLKMFCESTQYV
jgi:hypothetical protein